MEAFEATVRRLEAALEEVHELIEGYVDIAGIDGETGQPQPNKAMQAQAAIREALG